MPDTPPPPPPTGPAPVRVHRFLPVDRSVLLVDDDPEDRDGTAALLLASAIPVRPVASVQEALAFLEHRRAPGLILLDPRMPERSGRDFLLALAMRPDRERFRVVLVSADPSAANFRGLACVVEVLPKPVDPGLLVRTLRRFL